MLTIILILPFVVLCSASRISHAIELDQSSIGSKQQENLFDVDHSARSGSLEKRQAPGIVNTVFEPSAIMNAFKELMSGHFVKTLTDQANQLVKQVAQMGNSFQALNRIIGNDRPKNSKLEDIPAEHRQG